ncbi:MAG: hypothetical protein J6R17_09510 [Bacteroidales bacterium]|nr:hypothetical protein [Bacteroidales bacterium]
MKTLFRNSKRIVIILFIATFFTNCFAQETDVKKSWSEVVTSQPKGFAIGEDGNITISDAEGFTWIISVANGLNGVKQNTLEGKTIFITNDLDMSEYQWTPLKPFNFTIKGDDVKIKGLPVKDLLEKNHTTDFVFHIEGVVFDFNLWSIEFPKK